MKILYFNATSEIGGADRSLLVLLRHLPDSFDKVVVLPAPGPWSEEFSAKARIVYIPAAALKSFFQWCLQAPLTAWRYAVLMHREHPDVVHLNSSVLVLPGLVAHLFGKRIVWHVREMALRPRLAAWLLRWTIQLLADDIVCISQAVASEFPRRKKLHIIYNGVELPAAFPPREPAQVLGVVARFVPFKGIENVVRVAAPLKKVIPGLKLRVAGGAVRGREAYADALRKRSLEAFPEIEWSGWVPSIAEWLSDVDLLVHLPRDPEPLGRVVLEAAAAGIPSVVYGLGGIKEVVQEGETGFIVAAGDEAAAAERIKTLLSDEALRRTMGEKARRWVQERFSAKGYADAVRMVYESK
jgi:glycosyltransferase involved in cell wall biosynthesis